VRLLRNNLVHHYFGVDVAVVWAVVERALPVLKQQAATMLEELS
jgi:uncharacterized protein with HEPN domain